MVIITLLHMASTFIISLTLCFHKKKKAKITKTAKLTESQISEVHGHGKQNLPVQKTQSTVIVARTPRKTPPKAKKIKVKYRPPQAKTKSSKSQRQNTQKTQPSTKNLLRLEDIIEDDKEVLEANDREVSSHGTLQYILPRVRYVERADEIRKKELIDKHRSEYRTLKFIENEDLSTANICLRDVRPQDIIECKIEKYDVVGYKLPEILEEHTCRDE